MNFPIIKTIDDVLPAIKGHDEFKVCERPFGTVINYMVQLPDSFDDPIRRECRGIIFYPDGRIMSRPFHKFFNLGERNETRPANLDFGMDTVIMDKLDGSMIRPIYNGNVIHLGTKMGMTDVALQAESWVRAYGNEKHAYFDFIRECHALNLTPLFEWCSRSQRIVVDYPDDQLILTAIRNNITGHYFQLEGKLIEEWNIPTVKRWTKGADLEDLLEHATAAKDMEGWVCAWPCGKRVKIKVDWYVTLHKVKECIAREKYVIDAILDEYLDDLKGKLQEADLRAVEQFEGPFTAGVLKLVDQVGDEWNGLQIRIMEDRRVLSEFMEDDIALERGVKKSYASYVQTKPSWMRPILFSLYDKKIEYPSQGVFNMLKTCTSTQTQIDANRHLWGGARYNYGGANIDA